MEQRHTELVQLIEQYYEHVVQLQNTVSQLQKQLAQLPEQIGYYDSLQNDLLHELELMPLDAVKGTLVLKQLKHVRKERRLYKNIQAFEQQEHHNLRAIDQFYVAASPLETPKIYTYRTVEGYQFHQSLNIGREENLTKPPKQQKKLKSEQASEDGYRIVRKNKQWQLYQQKRFVVAYKQLNSMHHYLEEHRIKLNHVSEHEELFEHYLIS